MCAYRSAVRPTVEMVVSNRFQTVQATKPGLLPPLIAPTIKPSISPPPIAILPPIKIHQPFTPKGPVVPVPSSTPPVTQTEEFRKAKQSSKRIRDEAARRLVAKKDFLAMVSKSHSDPIPGPMAEPPIVGPAAFLLQFALVAEATIEFAAKSDVLVTDSSRLQFLIFTNTVCERALKGLEGKQAGALWKVVRGMSKGSMDGLGLISAMGGFAHTKSDFQPAFSEAESQTGAKLDPLDFELSFVGIQKVIEGKLLPAYMTKIGLRGNVMSLVVTTHDWCKPIEKERSNQYARYLNDQSRPGDLELFRDIRELKNSGQSPQLQQLIGLGGMAINIPGLLKWMDEGLESANQASQGEAPKIEVMED